MIQKTILLFVFLVMSVCTFANSGEWIFLGEEKASRRESSDTIIVQTRTFFDKIQIRISDESVFIDKYKIYFANGEILEAMVRRELSERESLLIDFPGNRRLISKIEVFYGGKRRHREKGSIQVFGFNKDYDKKQNKEWVLLGTREVAFRTEADTININHRNGRFEAVRLQVKKNSIFLKSLKIDFQRGQSMYITIGALIEEGKYSRDIDLPTDRRSINQITFYYNTAKKRHHRRGENAIVHIWGIKEDNYYAHNDYNNGHNDNDYNNGHNDNDYNNGHNNNGHNNSHNTSDWELLGESEVSLEFEKDTIRIFGRRKSADKIQIRVENRGVRFFDVSIYYTDGTNDDLPIQSFIDAGKSSRVFDLPRRKMIERIKFSYKSIRERGPKAKVQIWGKDK